MADNTGSPASMSKNKMKQLIWPEPLVVQPTGTHTHTIILLHGRGSNAERFGLELLKAQTSANNKTLPEHFPGLKFIFPTAKKRRAAMFNRTPINQWFDNGSLDEPLQKQDLQYDGLRETSAFFHGLITQEAQLVGVERVILGGLSQGCAAALHVLLNFQPDSGALLGFVGMCGWLPFAATFVEPAGEDDIFDAEPANPVPDLVRLQLSAANTARDIASLPALDLDPNQSPAFARTPVFLGHGTHDEKVVIKLGEQARDVLQQLGCQVEWKEYDEGHLYKVPEQIDDLVVWLKSRMLF
ncbi:Alpha/Beta hydrolase protein [Mycena albidolilacea]|uniref:Acyl-protein thioesterase 1 n=1 Tax=Mycena albidolilacea TaxID=1033008 RepID=A0AAD7A7T4_9AGAR|nr:Alpha/Beta hydrolase protein [Mycena albidolilacea]